LEKETKVLTSKSVFPIKESLEEEYQIRNLSFIAEGE
jgi:hypothetical protein